MRKISEKLRQILEKYSQRSTRSKSDDHLSKHFKRSEFACRCGCGYDAVDIELIDVLEDIRKRFKEPVIISSGCRCDEHNATVGGSIRSKHLIGQAADIVLMRTRSPLVAAYLRNKYHDKYGIGQYPGWVHIDVRKEKARWTDL